MLIVYFWWLCSLCSFAFGLVVFLLRFVTPYFVCFGWSYYVWWLLHVLTCFCCVCLWVAWIVLLIDIS